MEQNISVKQKEIYDFDKGCVVVKACPGSGKTFSVAARISRLLKEKNFINSGIAAMSFTNVAADEIKLKLKTEFGVAGSLSYPNYLGTIDRFINTYIFLPHGHLITGSTKRPELVGAPHRSWTKGKGDRKYSTIKKGVTICTYANPESYFDCVSFNMSNEIYPTVSAQEFHFSWSTYYKKDGTPVKKIQDIIDAKMSNFKLGFATQSDANYLSWKVLEQFPLIAQSIAKKFEYFIVDEAQDTDEIQMRIIELLQANGAGNIMLIGDRDQSIFEWNNADPALFDAKYNAWGKIDLDENWRSSQRICNFTRALSSFGRSFAKSPKVAKYDFEPVIRGYSRNDVSSMQAVLNEFFASSEQNLINLNPENIAVLYRGKAMTKYLGFDGSTIDFTSSPWRSQNYHVKDIIQGKVLFELGKFREGYRHLEKGYFEALYKPANADYYCSSNLITSYIETQGFSTHRETVFKFINLLPATHGKTIENWVIEANQKFLAAGQNIVLLVNAANAKIPISEYYSRDIANQNSNVFYSGTIHSVKGKSFESVLVMLDKKAGTHSNYSTILTKGAKPEEEEEMRTVYVGLTRPKKILMLAVPNEDVDIWTATLTGA